MTFFLANNPHLYIAIAISVLNGIFLCFVGYKFLHILQLSNYKINGYLAWIKDTKGNYISRVFMLSLLSFGAMMVLNVLFSSYSTSGYYNYLGIIFYFYFSYVFTQALYTAPKKTPLKNTHRMNRLTVFSGLLVAGITFVLIFIFTEYVSIVNISIISITPLLLPIIMPFANFILEPFENLNQLGYVIKAKKKLKEFPNLVVIGITGSYGKTTTKNILNSMLSEKYNVLATPLSFNTPMGLSKTINDMLDKNHEIFIAEMGARNLKDIKFLCNFVKPDIGIVTSVGSQHLRTFKTLDNIKKAKYELVEGVSKDGMVVFNGENEICREFYNKCDKLKYISYLADPSGDIYAKNIKLSTSTLDFTICYNGKEVDCSTKLLGIHNLQNILVSALTALKLEVSLEQIASAINKLQPVKHRLEIVPSENDVTVIDDTYNASVESTKSALEFLSMFEGRKIVITPGIVEMGNEEYKVNYEFAKNLAKVADIVFIINKTNQEAIKYGLTQNGFSGKNIYEFYSLQEAQFKLKDFLQKGDVVLFENDLPDNYT